MANVSFHSESVSDLPLSPIDSQLATSSFIAFVMAYGTLVFYKKSFSLASTLFSFPMTPGNQIKFLAFFMLWLHILSVPSFKCSLFCSCLCGVIQVHPIRKRFQQATSNIWPGADIAGNLRQVMGPPFVIYTIAAACMSQGRSKVVFTSFGLAVFAAVFARPDNDWAYTHKSLQKFVRVKKVHGVCMGISFVSSFTLLIFCWIHDYLYKRNI